MLLRGELDALLFYPPVRDVVDPHGGSYALVGHPGVRKLFPDVAAEGRRYFAATGIYPINHCVVVRRQLAQADPFLVEHLYAAFTTAKEEQERRRSSLLEPYWSTGVVSASLHASPDPAPYGFAANRRAIATISTYLYEQGLTDRVVDLAEIIPPNMLGT